MNQFTVLGTTAAVISASALGACGRADRTQPRRESTRVGGASAPTASSPAWTTDAKGELEHYLQLQRFDSTIHFFELDARECYEGGDEEPPPGLALVAARLADDPIVSVDSEPQRATVRAIVTSVARSRHHDGGDQVDVDVDVGVRVDTLEWLVVNTDGEWKVCSSPMFLHREHLDWAVVKSWTPPNGSWDMVRQLADSVAHAGGTPHIQQPPR